MKEILVRDSLSLLTRGVFHNKGELKSNPDFSEERYLNKNNKLREKHISWMKSLGVVGFGLGEKLTHGQYHSHIALRVYVNKKEPLSKVKQRIPSSVVIPDLGRVETDVIEIGKIKLHSLNRRVRPIAPGYSIGNQVGTSGSIGCVVKGKDGRIYILSSAHVLSDFDPANQADLIFQPSLIDDPNGSKNAVARLSKFLGFDTTPGTFNNVIDAALAEVRWQDVTNIISLIGIAPRKINPDLFRGMVVKKVGSETELTLGQITEVDYQYATLVPTQQGRRKVAGFWDQVACTPFATEGDSGSAVLDQGNALVGLHMAGNERFSIFNKIENVFTALDVRLL